MTEFICRRCCRVLTNSTKFFMTGCSHLICFQCAKKVVCTDIPPDSNNLYTVVCPVEKSQRKILPLEKLPPAARLLFQDPTKVWHRCFTTISHCNATCNVLLVVVLLLPLAHYHLSLALLLFSSSSSSSTVATAGH